MKKHILSAGAILCFATLTSQAASLVEWNIDGYDSTFGMPTAATYATMAEGLTSGNWSFSAGLGQPDSSGGLIGNNWSTAPALDQGALNSTPHASFTVTADAGSELILTDLSYASRLSGTTTPLVGSWGYRIDNGSGFGAWVLQDSFTLGSTSFTSENMPTWDFSDFSTTGSVEFAFFAAGAATAEDGVRILSRVDGGISPGLIINGTVTAAVPEPSTWALLGIGAAVLAIRKRKLT